MSTFVSVGNGTQSFSRLLTEVKRIAHLLPQPVVVQCGHTDPKICEGLQVFTFVDVATFKKLLGESDVFICHGGGGSIFTALGLGKKPVVVPRLDTYREIVDDHQMIFARELARQGKIILVEDVAQLLAASTQDASNYLYNDVREMRSDPVEQIALQMEPCVSRQVWDSFRGSQESF